MPEYTLAAIAWLVAALGLAAFAGILGQRRTWLAFGVFLAFTVVFDGILTGLPIVTYGPEHLSGVTIGTTPVEDYLYGQALFLLAVAAFELARRRWPVPGRAAADPKGRPSAASPISPDRP
ncbi:MAG: lycopene cyclase domain-containing protein [Chloroflexi bacterium]|jgi:lycopene cyclase domain-containing protein|nr:lycopene cyclase domain-containing protein [Chloroflexota bacterium]